MVRIGDPLAAYRVYLIGSDLLFGSMMETTEPVSIRNWCFVGKSTMNKRGDGEVVEAQAAAEICGLIWRFPGL